MNFGLLKSTCDEFRKLLREATGREVIDAVSLDEPKGSQDELHFLKLISWCYVFIFEASHPVARFILSLLRTSNPEQHKAVSAIFETVNNLRTVCVHNLSPQNKRDDYKSRQSRIWLIQSGGDPLDWPSCCRSLSQQVADAIRCLIERWHQATAVKEDAETVVKELAITIDREWPPHVFDRLVETAARNIGLDGLDCSKYRESRLDKWRELIGFFETREHAEVAISGAIRRESEHLFGVRSSIQRSIAR
jgi:hypothetical protein